MSGNLTELQAFLDELGFPDVYEMLCKNQITTVKALTNMEQDDLEEIGCTAFVAKLIVKNLSRNRSASNQAAEKVDITKGESLEVVLYKTELQGMKKNFENDCKFATLEHQLQLEKSKNAAEKELQKAKMDAELSLLKQQREFDAKAAELKAEIAKAEMEGKLKVLESKMAVQPAQTTVLPPYYGVSPYLGIYPPDTTLLTPHFHSMIQSWLGGPRHWVLRYRGSRNGFSAAQYHALCNGVGSTVTIVRSTGGYLFGGYNPSSWTSSNTALPGASSFIFTLTNPYGTPPTPFYYKGGNGPYDHVSYLPTWGSYDIYISSNCNSSTSSSTSFPTSYNDTLGRGSNTFTGSSSFQVSDIEVFSV